MLILLLARLPLIDAPPQHRAHLSDLAGWPPRRNALERHPGGVEAGGELPRERLGAHLVAGALGDPRAHRRTLVGAGERAQPFAEQLNGILVGVAKKSRASKKLTLCASANSASLITRGSMSFDASSSIRLFSKA